MCCISRRWHSQGPLPVPNTCVVLPVPRCLSQQLLGCLIINNRGGSCIYNITCFSWSLQNKKDRSRKYLYIQASLHHIFTADWTPACNCYRMGVNNPGLSGKQVLGDATNSICRLSSKAMCVSGWNFPWFFPLLILTEKWKLTRILLTNEKLAQIEINQGSQQLIHFWVNLPGWISIGCIVNPWHPSHKVDSTFLQICVLFNLVPQISATRCLCQGRLQIHPVTAIMLNWQFENAQQLWMCLHLYVRKGISPERPNIAWTTWDP